MKIAISLLVLLFARTDDPSVSREKARVTAGEHARTGEWLEVMDDVSAMARSESLGAGAPSDAGVTMYELLTKYETPDNQRRLILLGVAERHLREAIRRDRDHLPARKYLPLVLKERLRIEESPVSRESVASMLKIAEEQLVDAQKVVRLQPGETWGVALIQDDTVEHPADNDGTMVLRRAPFTIRVLSTNKSLVEINAADTDVNFKRVRDGYRDEECSGKVRIPFCSGSAFPDVAGRLNVDPDGAHLVFVTESENRWSKITPDGLMWILDRDVTSLGDASVEQSTVPRLYLTILQRGYNDGVIHEDAIRRIAVRFR
ncbi:MAG TPA: hypothetical protein VFV49_07650 [Thermoanaerobaculia bacterium]|nr:hypothetical protein [Thermoanaerobaculia bacterium]